MLIEHKLTETINKSLAFTEKLKVSEGFKYTINHDEEKYPAATLYGTWSVAFIKRLLIGDSWDDEYEKVFILNHLNRFRLSDGTYLPKELLEKKPSKSIEYLKLHCYNYAVGAAIEVDHNYDFQSSYMDFFLFSDNLQRWLEQRSLQRPWEESNNIVNVASYLALCNDHGDSRGKERLYQMLEWHNSVQNPKTGGFENLPYSRRNVLQSMAGAVHNFHIHHYLNEPMNYEQIIGENVIPFLFEGPLTACLSIDFVELACHVLPFMDDPYELKHALFFHLNALFNYQNSDGGFFENESPSQPTTAHGMKETVASSNSYATWFRMCSIGMIAITLLGDDPNKWQFRKTLGMGYHSDEWKPEKLKSFHLDQKVLKKYRWINRPYRLKRKLIEIGAKILNR